MLYYKKIKFNYYFWDKNTSTNKSYAVINILFLMHTVKISKRDTGSENYDSVN